MIRWGLMFGAVAALAALAGCGPAGVWREHFHETAAGEKGPAERKPLDASAMFRAQELWDATMAASILKAAKDGKGKVIHLAGAFHSDFGGGLLQRLRGNGPDLPILTVSLVPAHSRRLRRADRGRADVLVYTGGE